MSNWLGKIITTLFPNGSWGTVYNYLCGKDGIAPTSGSLLMMGFAAALFHVGIMLLLPSPNTLRKWIMKSRHTIRVADFVQGNKTIKFAQIVIWSASFFWIMNAAVWFLASVCAANSIELRGTYTAVAYCAFLYVVLCSAIWFLYRLVRKNEYRGLLVKKEILPIIHSVLADKFSEIEANDCDPAIRVVASTSWILKKELFDLWYEATCAGVSLNGSECLDAVLDVIYNDERPYKWMTKRGKQAMERVRDALGR